MDVPFFRPQREYKKYQQEIDGAISKVLESGQLVLGSSDEIVAFEDAFAKFIGTEYAVMTGSGTQSLAVAYKAAGIKSGDEVICVSMTFIATIDQIVECDAKPILLDIVDGQPLMDVAKIEAAITPKTRAIVPVHLEGAVCDMDVILDIAKRHNLIVIEDAAQAIGATYKGRGAGSMGLAGCFSFFPAKCLGSLGNAGMVTTNDGEIARRARMIRANWNIGKNPDLSAEYGNNYEPDAIHASVLNVKIKYLPERLDKRKEIADRYFEAFAGSTPLYLPVRQDGRVYQDFVVRTRTSSEKDDLVNYLKGAGVQTLGTNLIPNHRYPNLKLDFDLPKTEAYLATQIRLPCNPDLTDEEVDYVIEKVTGFYKA